MKYLYLIGLPKKNGKGIQHVLNANKNEIELLKYNHPEVYFYGYD